jgi:hypothetical protein
VKRLKLSQNARAYIYRIALAAGTVAAFYGWISSEEVALWGGFAATVLSTGLAAANTKTSTGRHSAD